MDATWAVFFVPAAILMVWACSISGSLRTRRSTPAFRISTRTTLLPDTCTRNTRTLELLKKVFLSPLMLMFAFVELTAGVLRNGIMQWYTSLRTR